MLYSEINKGDIETADCLIIDCYGLLSSIYQYGDVTYVGGGFGAGIHNVLEAAVWNVPVIFGPNNHNFMEARNLIAIGGGFEINNYDDFDNLLNRFSSSQECLKQAGHFVETCTGATCRILSSIQL